MLFGLVFARPLACYSYTTSLRPIDDLIVVLLCTLGILGIILNRNAFVRLIGRVSGSGLWSVFGYVTAVLVIAARCAGPVFHYDTGFYGAMAVRWFVTYPLVPGLTNLLGQLGLNSSVFCSKQPSSRGHYVVWLSIYW